ncbi:MAG: hypothetical protein WAT79_01270 [Saprospiraceae bacterium]
MKYFLITVFLFVQLVTVWANSISFVAPQHRQTSPPPVCGCDNLGPGLNGPVYALAHIGNQIYVGGNFTDAGGNPNADFIALWDGTSWQSLGTGLNDEVRSIFIDGSTVYVGGQFTDAGGNPNADGISTWNGTTWSSLGSGISGIVNTIVKNNSEIFVGGYFIDAGGVPNANHIAMWDGAWNNVGASPNNEVFCIAFSTSNMFIGGSFTAIGTNTNAARIARWDGVTWNSLGNGVNNSVYSILFLYHNNTLIIGGNFTDVGTDPNADYIVEWSITLQLWSSIPGFNGAVHSIIFKDYDIYIGGAFSAAGGNYDANGIARIVDNQLQGGFGGGVTTGHVKSLHFIGDIIIVGGQFINLGTNPDADNIAQFDLMDVGIYTFNGSVNDDYHNVGNWICGLNPPMKGYGTIYITAECQLGNQELNGKMIVQNGVNMSVGGTLFITRHGEFENFGSIENNGDIITHNVLNNYGMVTNLSLMEFDTTSLFICQPSSTFINEIGSILNNKNYFSIIDNLGNFTVKSGSILNNNGGIVNYNNMLMEGLFNNFEDLASEGTMTISGIFTNSISGWLRNDTTGIMEITVTGKIDNQNIFENKNLFYNRNIINNFAGSLLSNSGDIENFSGSVIHNSGVMNNVETGTIKIYQNAAINNTAPGKFENYTTGVIENNGTIENKTLGIMINKTGGIFINHPTGLLVNQNMGIFTQNGTLTNNGFASNEGTWNNNGSTTNFNQFTNHNVLNNTNNFFNSFVFLNLGTIDNTKLFKNNVLGILTNEAGSYIFNNGTGTIENEGNFENVGEITNDANIVNKLHWISTGFIENNNSFINQFEIDNRGTIFNSSSFLNEGTLYNSNHVTNNSTGTITNQLGTIFNDSIGLINNEGLFNNFGDVLNHAMIRNKMNWVTTGTFENFDTLQNKADALFDMQSTGLFYNRENAVVVNENDAVFKNSIGSGSVLTEYLSSILNHGLIINDESMVCYGQLIIYSGGTVINNHQFAYGQILPLIIHLNGTFQNNVMGHFEGYQVLTITGEGLFNNEGEFIIIE